MFEEHGALFALSEPDPAPHDDTEVTSLTASGKEIKRCVGILLVESLCYTLLSLKDAVSLSIIHANIIKQVLFMLFSGLLYLMIMMSLSIIRANIIEQVLRLDVVCADARRERCRISLGL